MCSATDFGASAAPFVIETLEASLRASGYRVRRNKPFAGGYITERFGAPAENVHAVQIEIARALYLDERRIVRNARWTTLRDDLLIAACALAAVFEADAGPARLAAE